MSDDDSLFELSSESESEKEIKKEHDDITPSPPSIDAKIIQEKINSSSFNKELDWLTPLSEVGSGQDAIVFDSKFQSDNDTFPVAVRVSPSQTESFERQKNGDYKVRIVKKTIPQDSDEYIISQYLSLEHWPNFITIYGTFRCTSTKIFTKNEIYANEARKDALQKKDLTFCSRDPRSFSKKASKFGTYQEQRTFVPADYDMTVLELVSTNWNMLKQEVKDEKLWTNIQYSCLAQLCCALQQAQDQFGFEHNDLHSGNILLHPSTEPFATYNIRGTVWKIPLFGWIPVIIDYGYSRMTKIKSDSKTVLATDNLQTMKKEYKIENNLPLDPLRDPIRPWYDVMFMTESIFYNQNSMLDLFMGLYGAKLDFNNARPKTPAHSFEPINVVEYLYDSSTFVENILKKTKTTKPIDITFSKKQ